MQAQVAVRGKMRIIALLVLLFGFSEAALAQTPECKSTRAADLLACYEGGAPPLAAIKHAAPKTATASHKSAASKAPADQEQVVDFLEAENSKLDAKLRTICRGC
jgi:hypothetical protein